MESEWKSMDRIHDSWALDALADFFVCLCHLLQCV